MGVVPKNAIDHSAMTRPRICGLGLQLQRGVGAAR